MDIGMLWFDNDKKETFETKLRRAVEYYIRKYDKHPNLCFVHSSTMPENLKNVDGVELRVSKSMLPNHFWIGINA